MKADRGASERNDVEDANDIQRMNNLAMEKLTLFRVTHDSENIDAAIALFRKVAALRQGSDRAHFMATSNLAYAINERFEGFHRSEDLDESITLLRHAADFRQPDEERFISHLDIFADAVRHRFESFGRNEDLEETISIYRRIYKHCPSDNPNKPAYANNLANILKTRFEQQERIADLDGAIELYQESLTQIPTDHVSRPLILHNLSTSFHARYQQAAQQQDLDQAIVFGQASIDASPSNHPERRRLAHNTAANLSLRFEILGSEDDLNAEIAIRQDDLASLDPNTPSYVRDIAALMFRLNIRFEKFHRAEDVDTLIHLFQLTLASLTPDQVTPRIGALVALGSEFERRFDLHHQENDLDGAITSLYEGLSLCPEGHPLGAHTHINGSLIRCLRMRFQLSHCPEDLEEMIHLGHGAITIRSLSSYERFMFTNDLANDLSTRFESSGQLDDLDKSIELRRKVCDLCPSDFPEQFRLTLGLAVRLMARYQRLGHTQDLEDSISLHLQTLASLSSGHDARGICIHSLIEGSKKHLEWLSDGDTFDDALQLHATALEELQTTPSFTSLQQTHLPCTAGAVISSLLEHARVENIEEIAGKCCQTIALSIPTLGSMSSPIIDLAKRMLEAGRSHDLDGMIALYRQVLDLYPVGHEHHPICLYNLAAGHMLRFDLINTIEDLDEAVSLYRQAFENADSSHPSQYPIAVRFIRSLLVRFGYTGDFENLTEALTIHLGILTLQGVHEVTYIPSKKSEGISAFMEIRLGRIGNTKSYEEAVKVCCEAVVLCSPGHPDRPFAQGGAELDTHATTYEALLMRSKKLREGMEETFLILSAYLASGIRGVLVADESLFVLARLYALKQNFDVAFSMYNDSTQSGSPTHGFRSSLTWAHLASENQHPSDFQAYTRALQLSERCLVMRPTVELQYKFMTSEAARELSSLAASHAIEEGNLEAAVEMLEQGRGRLWSKLRSYRHPFGNSPGSSRINFGGPPEEFGDDHTFLSGITSELEDFTTSTLEEKFGRISLAGGANARFERDSAPHRQLLNTLNEMSSFDKKIVSGLDSSIPFSTLKTAAVDGPVIMVSLSRQRSDALIVRTAGAPILVTLDKKLPHIVSRLCRSLFQLKNSRLHQAESEPRASRPAIPVSDTMISILRDLWDKICAPVVSELEKLQVKKQSRIWWCPTGALIQLPLHAAGPYLPEKPNLCDLYISSYTPTLASLIQARKSAASTQTPTSSYLLAVGQSVSLPQVRKEFSVLQELFTNRGTLRDNAEATPNDIILQLKQHRWVHLACHGELKPAEPFESSFKLHDGDLSLRQIMRANIPNAELAFLAACHTMRSDAKGNPDEGLSLATAVQFCGFRSVVGTLWAMSDGDGPALAREFYEFMLRNGMENIKVTDAAVALHKSVEALRHSGAPLEHWTTFVHVGI